MIPWNFKALRAGSVALDVRDDAEPAPPCIACGRPLEGPTYTGDCLAACNEECYERAWLAQSPRPGGAGT